MSFIATSVDGAAVVLDRALVLYDVKGARIGEQKLDKRGEAVARFGDEWLVLGEKQKHLARLGGSEPAFASGKAPIGAFGVGRDDAVAVARGETIELWSRDDERKWAAKGGPFTQAVVARDHVVALDEGGALVFFARDKGDALGALRLASTEPAADWRLTHVDGGIVVLALGDWLVWVDASTRKTVRRVRAKAKVLAICADAEHVAVAVEEGFVQAFKSSTGEPRATFTAHEDGVVSAIALGIGTLFTIGGSDVLKVCDRGTLDVTTRAASPVCAIAMRGELAAVGDKSGRVRVYQTQNAELRELATTTPGGEAPAGIHILKNETLVIAGQRVVMRVFRGPSRTAPNAWQTPRPIALRAPPTAFAADDAYAFAGTQAGAVDVYDLEGGRHVTTYALSQDDRITALLRLAGATLVVGTGALDGRVLIVDVADAKVVHRISPHEEAFGVTCLAADARGRIIASGGDDGSVALLDPGKGRVLARIRVNETPTAMAFEPTGRRLACVFADGTSSIVSFAQKGATVSDLGVRGATHVSWGDGGLVFGFKDGHVESGERHTRPSERPAARQ